MKKTFFSVLIITMLLALPLSSIAGVKMKIGDDTNIDLGFRLQAQLISSDNSAGTSNGPTDPADSETRVNMRRQRLRLGGNVGQYMSFFLQTDGRDVTLIDAFIKLKLHPMAQIIMGENMAPAGRQITTSSGGLMAIDRPGITNYNLTWGLNGRAQFNNVSVPSSGNLADAGAVAVRDTGATLFGSTSFSDTFHMKYYAGVYDGINNATVYSDTERYTGRVQINFLDAEAGYYNLSTYVGKKKTIALGLSYDAQSDFETDDITGKNVDYTWYSADLFAELPVGPGTITAEFGYNDLDLDDATSIDGVDARKTQGGGFYTQAGFLINKFQPWIGYETWDSDSADNDGSWDAAKIGITYFLKGHNANIKLGYEAFTSDKPLIAGGTEDSINTLILGFYITY